MRSIADDGDKDSVEAVTRALPTTITAFTCQNLLLVCQRLASLSNEIRILKHDVSGTSSVLFRRPQSRGSLTLKLRGSIPGPSPWLMVDDYTTITASILLAWRRGLTHCLEHRTSPKPRLTSVTTPLAVHIGFLDEMNIMSGIWYVYLERLV